MQLPRTSRSRPPLLTRKWLSFDVLVSKYAFGSHDGDLAHLSRTLELVQRASPKTHVAHPELRREASQP